MVAKAVGTCTECGQTLEPFDETCPGCGELTPLGRKLERATRREAGLPGYQRMAPRIVAAILVLAIAALLFYAVLNQYGSSLNGFLQDLVRQLPGATPTPAR